MEKAKQKKMSIKGSCFVRDAEFNGNFRRITSEFETVYFPKYLEFWKGYYLNMQDREQFIKKWQTNIAFALMYIVISTYNASLRDVVVDFKVAATDENDETKVKKEKVIKDALVWAYQTTQAKDKIFEGLEEALVCGDMFLRYGFTNKEVVNTYRSYSENKMVTETRNIIKPTLSYKSIFNMFYDFTGSETSAFHAERKVILTTSLEEKYGAYFKLTEEQRQKVFNNYEFFIYREWDFEKLRIAFHASKQYNNIQDINNLFGFNSDLDSKQKEEKYKGFCEVIEYYSGDKLRIVVNGYTCFNGDNPLPNKEAPYIHMGFRKIGGSCMHIGLGHILLPLQKLGSALLNAFTDDTKLRSVPIVMRKMGSTTLSGIRSSIDLEPGKVYDVDDPDSITPLSWGSPNMSIREVIDMIMEIGFMATSMNNYTVGGTDNKIERSAQGVLSKVAQLRSQLIPVFNKLNTAMAQLGKGWIGLMKSYLPKDYKVKIVGADGLSVMESIDVAMLDSEFDVFFDSEALKQATKDAQINNILKFLEIAIRLQQNPNTAITTLNFEELVSEAAALIGVDKKVLMDQATARSQIEDQQLWQARLQSKVQILQNSILSKYSQGAGQGAPQQPGIQPGQQNPQQPQMQNPESVVNYPENTDDMGAISEDIIAVMKSLGIPIDENGNVIESKSGDLLKEALGE